MSSTEIIAAKLEQAISRITSILADQGSENLQPTHPLWAELEALVSLVSSISHPDWTKLTSQHPKLLDHRPMISQLYAQYIAAQELAAVEDLLQSGASKDHLEAGKLGTWGQKAYDRVADLFEFVDFSNCQRLVMVGCGPLPVTLLHILHRTNIPKLIAIDIDPDTINGVNRLIEQFEWERLTAICCDGISYDYENTDIVYLANLLSPKTSILEKVASRVASGTQIILRDPAGSGEMFADVGIPVDSETLEIQIEGPSDSHFLSRDIFLRKR